MPVSSRASRRAEASAVSPMSTKPPGTPRRPRAGSFARRTSSTRPSRSSAITPAATAGLKW